jgi:hypothetical protein
VQNILLLVPLPAAAAAACFTSTPSNIIQPKNRKVFQLAAIFHCQNKYPLSNTKQ